jgi:hypothetical protein
LRSFCTLPHRAARFGRTSEVVGIKGAISASLSQNRSLIAAPSSQRGTVLNHTPPRRSTNFMGPNPGRSLTAWLIHMR